MFNMSATDNHRFQLRHPKSSFKEALKTVTHTVFWGALWTVLLVGLYQFWIDLHNPELLPIRHVQVISEGDLHIPKSLLETAVNHNLSGTLLSLKESNLKQELMQFPWVANVSIRRVWPGTLKIRISPQSPVARWGQESLMNSDLELFSPAPDTFPKDLPLLDGPKGAEREVWKEYQFLNEQFDVLKLKVVSVELSARHSWSFALSNGIWVILGRENLDKRLQRLIKLYPKLFAPRADEIAQIDLRYPNGFAVKAKAKGENKNLTH